MATPEALQAEERQQAVHRELSMLAEKVMAEAKPTPTPAELNAAVFSGEPLPESEPGPTMPPLAEQQQRMEAARVGPSRPGHSPPAAAQQPAAPPPRPAPTRPRE